MSLKNIWIISNETQTINTAPYREGVNLLHQKPKETINPSGKEYALKRIEVAILFAFGLEIDGVH